MTLTSAAARALADKDAGFKSITLKPVPESATRVAMIQSGDAQPYLACTG